MGARRRPRARALVRPADRRPQLPPRLPRAPLGSAADRRRHAPAAANRRPRPRARPDPDRADHRNRRGARLGSADRGGRRRRPSRPRPRDRRRARPLSPADDALRSPFGDRGLDAPARREPRVRGGRRARVGADRHRGRGPLRRWRGARRRGRRRYDPARPPRTKKTGKYSSFPPRRPGVRGLASRSERRPRDRAGRPGAPPTGGEARPERRRSSARSGTPASDASRSRPRPTRSPRCDPRAACRGSSSRAGRRPERSRRSCSS